MNLTFSEEQEELRASVRRFLTDKAPSEAVRRWSESDLGHDEALWQQMAGQLGLQGIAVPEEHGGAGFGPVELGIVLEEMGRALLPSPFFATVALAGQALTASGDREAQARWLPAIAEGTLTATVAVSEERGGTSLDAVATTATPDGSAWTLTGTKMFVVDGDSAGLLLVVARADDGLGLFTVEGTAGGVTRTRLDALDLTRRLGRVELDGTPAVRVGPAGDATEFLRRMLDLAVVAQAHEQVGGAAACLDAAVEYAKIRVQFNRPIGSFQAIKHKCADLLLEVEAARSAAYSAAWNAAEDPAELPVSATVAGSYCAEAYTHAAKENIQIHGGIGYTWEHDAHLHLRRAKSSEALFGSPRQHRSRLADLVGI
ncbi:acyl-CoA dehydrogenase family protein [Cryptosporangium aurantiacum]|uniref:Acyl-CoA dehydrogenase n=1 Tax=Cryptosporangium aurantiacum TaxID=134849 RepID=A0A1M7R4R0_9ACTN|nr:acyl-CoA dehydrogenase family protein [Cryptosporangium aurantiacum]SHN39970.1 Acyl-CoA dehydrogenase [Cryptosporangium aurantiacum]